MRLRRKTLMDRMNPIDRATVAVMGVGALNWGLVGLFNFDVVRAVLGSGSKATRTVYLVVGASGAYAVARAAQMANHN